ncbi:hypothetical protein ZWY2020_020717 [Hordeum vulgare]|nr:hypothetical protein ZWY2020_020717 [Hordeum vulgare]
MSLPPPPPPLNTTTAPLPQTTTTAPPLLPLTSGTAPSPVPIITAEEPLPILSPEAISGTLRELVQAVRGISLYLAGTQPPPPSVAPTTYGPPSLPWATPAFQPLHGGAPPLPPQLLLQHYHAAGTPWPVWPATTAPLGGLPHRHCHHGRSSHKDSRRHRQQHLQPRTTGALALCDSVIAIANSSGSRIIFGSDQYPGTGTPGALSAVRAVLQLGALRPGVSRPGIREATDIRGSRTRRADISSVR